MTTRRPFVIGSVIFLVVLLVAAVSLYPRFKTARQLQQISIPATFQLATKTWDDACATYTYRFSGTQQTAVHDLKKALESAGYTFEPNAAMPPMWAHTTTKSAAISTFASETISLSLSDKNSRAFCGGG